MRKNIVLLSVILIAYGNCHAQDNAMNGAPTNVLGLNSTDEALLIANKLDISKISGVFYEFDDIRFGKVPTDGSFLLFENWNNRGVLVVSGENLTVSNINYHVDEEKFISQMDSDSTFVYDFKGIERIIVNNRPFISKYSSAEGKNKVYEIIAEGSKFSLLKHYSSEVIQGSTNPMVNRARNKIKLNTEYFVMINGGLLPFTTKKSGFKNLLTSKDASLIDAFVKQRQLTYRKDQDLREIFTYLNTL